MWRMVSGAFLHVVTEVDQRSGPGADRCGRSVGGSPSAKLLAKRSRRKRISGDEFRKIFPSPSAPIRNLDIQRFQRYRAEFQGPGSNKHHRHVRARPTAMLFGNSLAATVGLLSPE